MELTLVNLGKRPQAEISHTLSNHNKRRKWYLGVIFIWLVAPLAHFFTDKLWRKNPITIGKEKGQN